MTADLSSRVKGDFCQETYEMPIVSWKYSHGLEGEKAECKGTCRRQAGVRQYSRPARKVTADMCSSENVDFCRETYEMLASWNSCKLSPELKGEGEMQSHVGTTGRR